MKKHRKKGGFLPHCFILKVMHGIFQSVCVQDIISHKFNTFQNALQNIFPPNELRTKLARIFGKGPTNLSHYEVFEVIRKMPKILNGIEFEYFC